MNDFKVYQRFMRKIDVRGRDECHIWQGSTDHYGYAKSSINGKTVGVHRWLLGYVRGSFLKPGEMALHHCDVPLCCNPAHLYVGDHAQNMRDMNDRGRNQTVIAKREQTHCKHGHEFTPENTRIWMRGGRSPSRMCRACDRRRQAAYKARLREAGIS